MMKQTVKNMLAVLLIGAAGVLSGCGRPPVEGELLIQEESVSVEQVVEETAGTAQEAVLYVQICGQVLHPGVYAVEEGTRLFQVVERAGGLTKEAAADYLNLAEEARDGMKILVPSQSEVEASEIPGHSGLTGAVETSPEGTPKINLNTATKDQLMTLKGIGEAKASDIIKYRTEQGPFRQIEDIKEIPGIKDAAFEKIRESITV